MRLWNKKKRKGWGKIDQKILREKINALFTSCFASDECVQVFLEAGLAATLEQHCGVLYF